MPALGEALVRPAARVAGRIRVPGDKSISHRYAILAALADGPSLIRVSLSFGREITAVLIHENDPRVQARSVKHLPSQRGDRREPHLGRGGDPSDPR